MNKTPLRTCIICRNKSTKKDLIRIVRDKKTNSVFFDKSGKANGRGAYICSKDECIDLISNIKIINNALNVNVTKADMDDVKEDIKKYLKEEVFD